MSGNCDTGSTESAMTPAIEITVEMTNASRGRRMKTDEMVIRSPRLRERGGSGGGVYRHARPYLLLALHNHLVAGLEAFLDADQAVARHARLDLALLHHVLVVDDEDERAGLVDRDGGLLHGQHGGRVLRLDHDAQRLAIGQGV